MKIKFFYGMQHINFISGRLVADSTVLH